MTDFRTHVSIGRSTHFVGLKSKILTAGSCFANAIGQQLLHNKIQAMINPFGVIYNPHSIHKAIHYAVHNTPLPQHTFLKNHDVCLNYDFHSEFSSLHASELTYKISNTIGAAHYFLQDASWLLITYGTAWVYERADTGEVVANCHKMPASLFRKSLLTEKAIVDSFGDFYEDLKNYNPEIRVILTVSPVRHIKDTLQLNSVSKSILRLACHSISEKFEDVEYFPAYEIMIDDLRDYRFYRSDMLHPTEEAENYIWHKFIERYMDDETRKFIEEWKSISAALAHKPFHPASSAHQQFLKTTLKKLEALQGRVNVEREISFIKEQTKS